MVTTLTDTDTDTVSFTLIDSPVGPLRLVAGAHGLHALHMHVQRHVPATPDPAWRRDDGHPVLVATAAQLEQYFDGERHAFDLPLAPVGTEFQLRVWEGLRAIPYGATISYGELAQRVGNAKAVRAVGLANGRNPISIIVPCHRVVGANGSLTGYGGGLERKRFLLDLEAGRRPLG